MGVAEKFLGSKRDRFGKEVAARVRGHASVAHAEYDADDFVVRVQTSDGRQSVVNLATVFQECDGVSAAERRGRISRLVAIVDAPAVPDTWDQVRPLLRPVLRPASYVGPGEIVSRPVFEYLTELLAIDFPGGRTYVNPDSLRGWAVSLDEAFQVAHRNLAKTVTTTLDRARQLTAVPNLIVLRDDGDAYLTSLPLIDGWLASISRIVGTRALAIPVHNDLLLIAFETGDGPALTEVLKGAEKDWSEAARPISPIPYTADDAGNVVAYSVPEDHPACAALKHSAILLALSVYGPQTDQGRAAAGPDDPFMGALRGFRSPDGVERTVAAWTDDNVSLLPKADEIMFPKEGLAEMVRLPWDVVAEEVGLTPADGYHPARYRVGSWPAPEVLNRMKAHAEQVF